MDGDSLRESTWHLGREDTVLANEAEQEGDDAWN